MDISKPQSPCFKRALSGLLDTKSALLYLCFLSLDHCCVCFLPAHIPQRAEVLPAHLPRPTVVKLGAAPLHGAMGERRKAWPEREGKVCAVGKLESFEKQVSCPSFPR